MKAAIAVVEGGRVEKLSRSTFMGKVLRSVHLSISIRQHADVC